MSQITNYQDNRERQRAFARIQASSRLKPYAATIFSLLQDEQDWQWIAVAPEADIIRWALEQRDNEREEIESDAALPEREEDWQ